MPTLPSPRRVVRRVVWSAAHPRHRAPGGVALTFDDGPDPEFTPRVLEALHRCEVSATFFLVGVAAAARPDLVRAIEAAGHRIGSHTWSHSPPGALGTRALREDLRRGREVLEDILERPVPLFRPAQGHIDFRVTAAVRSLRLQPWLWTHDPEDWRPDRQVEVMLDALDGIDPGAVVLLHDGIRGGAPAAADRSATIAVIPELCRRVRARGLELATIPEG